MIGFYDYTVILTYLGFSSGMVGIFLAITEDTSISKELKYRWFALIVASIVYTYLIAFIY